MFVFYLLLAFARLGLPGGVEAMAPAKRPAAQLKAKPAVASGTMKTMIAAAGPVRHGSNSTGTAAKLRAMKQIMRTLLRQGLPKR